MWDTQPRVKGIGKELRLGGLLILSKRCVKVGNSLVRQSDPVQCTVSIQGSWFRAAAFWSHDQTIEAIEAVDSHVPVIGLQEIGIQVFGQWKFRTDYAISCKNCKIFRFF